MDCPCSGLTRLAHCVPCEILPGGESVSQSSLKDKAFLTFVDQNPPLEITVRSEMAFAAGKSLFGQRHMIANNPQATSEGKLAVRQLHLLAIPSFPSAIDAAGSRHNDVSRSTLTRSKETR